MPVFASAIVGYLFGLLCSYHFGRTWVFGHRFDFTVASVVRFLLVYAAGGLGMSTIITVLVNGSMLNHTMSWLVGATFAAGNNFIGLKWLVFGRRRKSV